MYFNARHPSGPVCGVGSFFCQPITLCEDHKYFSLFHRELFFPGHDCPFQCHLCPRLMCNPCARFIPNYFHRRSQRKQAVRIRLGIDFLPSLPSQRLRTLLPFGAKFATVLLKQPVHKFSTPQSQSKMGSGIEMVHILYFAPHYLNLFLVFQLGF